MRLGTDCRIAGHNDMTFQRHSIAQNHIAGDTTKRSDSNISTQLYAVFHNRGF